MTGAPVQERIVRTLGAGTEGSNPLCSSGESTSRAILPSHREKPAFRAGVRAYTCLSRGRCRSGYSSDRVLIRRICLAAGQPPGAVCAKPQTRLLKFSWRRGGLRSRTGSASTRGWDYVVVGAGAAGCVVAGRLSRTMPDVRIALIEAGGKRLGLTTKVPGTAFIASTSPRRNWNFETEPVPALNGRKLRWFQGRILGGWKHQRDALSARPFTRIRPVGAAWMPWVVVRSSAALLQKSRNQHARRQ